MTIAVAILAYLLLVGACWTIADRIEAARSAGVGVAKSVVDHDPGDAA